LSLLYVNLNDTPTLKLYFPKKLIEFLLFCIIIPLQVEN